MSTKNPTTIEEINEYVVTVFNVQSFGYEEPLIVERCKRVTEAGAAFAKSILINLPPCADRSDAVRKVREGDKLEELAKKGMIRL